MHSTTTRHGSFCFLADPNQSTQGYRHQEAATTKRLVNIRRILRARYGQAGAVDSAMRCLRERGQCVGRLCRSCGAADLHKVDQDDGVDLRHERDQLGKGTQSPAPSCNTCESHMPDELHTVPAKGTSSSRYSRAISLAPSRYHRRPHDL